ncbi:MAG TPA: branched-chain-amino-acid transaminase [Spirochaetia bacterium]
MAKGFSLEIDPWVYRAKFQDGGTWTEEYIEKPHRTHAEEDALSDAERAELFLKRNNFADIPLVNYTSQYGMGCFEGLKAFPQPDGSLKIFRPDENARRFEGSMKGLFMPPFPASMFVTAVRSVAARNKSLGFSPVYDPSWEKDDFIGGSAVYLRPFSYAEPGIGVGISTHPWVFVISTPVGAYFKPGNSRATTTRIIRATPGGTGWIKADSNYVASAIAKKKAELAGFMEAVFLDAKEHAYFEEGSSCNIFFVMKNGGLVTPSLEDTILPGITRKSVLALAKDKGIATEERRVSVKEVFAKAKECFVSGTAAGITPIESITHEGKEVVFCNREVGETTRTLLKTLKGIQYGALPDTHGWMVGVE